MIAKQYKEGSIEFILPDRKTVLVDTFRRMGNNESMEVGQQFLTNQITDGRTGYPILQTALKVTDTHVTITVNGSAVGLWTCLVFTNLNTKY